jgi:hypothetical protein
LGIGVFIRTNDKLHCVLMPGYSDADGTGTYLDFLSNSKEEYWVREGQLDEIEECWEVHPQHLRVPWPKLDASFDLSRPLREILGIARLQRNRRPDFVC